MQQQTHDALYRYNPEQMKISKVCRCALRRFIIHRSLLASTFSIVPDSPSTKGAIEAKPVIKQGMKPGVPSPGFVEKITQKKFTVRCCCTPKCIPTEQLKSLSSSPSAKGRHKLQSLFLYYYLFAYANSKDGCDVDSSATAVSVSFPGSP